MMKPGSRICIVAVIALLAVIGYGALSFFVLDKRPPGCIIDIDWTIVNTRLQRPIPQACPTLQWLDRCGLNIFYLSRRPTRYLSGTQKWLRDFDFPSGQRIILKESRRELPFHYKVREIRKLQEDYHILFGVGDKKADMRAYQECGIVSISMGSGWPEVKARIKNILEAEGITAGEFQEEL